MNLIVDKILNLYIKYGKSDYIGEAITQVDHAIQCAECAENDPRLSIYDDYIKNCMIVGALLHDIGHLVGLDKGDMEMQLHKTTQHTRTNSGIDGSSLGIVGHEGIGAHFLRECGMPYLVCELVESHVMAKRYLCSTNSNYYTTLSNASKETMVLQGGLMNSQEIKTFKSSIMPELKIFLREYDDLGKKILNGNSNSISSSNSSMGDSKCNSIAKYKKNIELALLHGKI